MKGFSFWPARVDFLPAHVELPKGKIPVFFYGTHQISFLSPKNLVNYEDYKELYGNRKTLIKAMIEIEADPEVLLLGKDPAAEEFWENIYPRRDLKAVDTTFRSRAQRSSSPVVAKASKRKTSRASRQTPGDQEKGHQSLCFTGIRQEKDFNHQPVEKATERTVNKRRLPTVKFDELIEGSKRTKDESGAQEESEEEKSVFLNSFIGYIQSTPCDSLTVASGILLPTGANCDGKEVDDIGNRQKELSVEKESREGEHGRYEKERNLSPSAVDSDLKSEEVIRCYRQITTGGSDDGFSGVENDSNPPSSRGNPQNDTTNIPRISNDGNGDGVDEDVNVRESGNQKFRITEERSGSWGSDPQRPISPDSRGKRSSLGIVGKRITSEGIEPMKRGRRKSPSATDASPSGVDALEVLRDLGLQLKPNLVQGHENFAAAVTILEHVCMTSCSLLQLTQVWELTDCVKKCRKYRLSAEVRDAASRTLAHFQRIQAAASKAEVLKAKAVVAKRVHRDKSTKPSLPPPATTTPGPLSTTDSPTVNSSPELPEKNKFSLAALRAELDAKADILLARLASTEARLKADRNKSAASSPAPSVLTAVRVEPVGLTPRIRTEEATDDVLSRVDEVANRLGAELNAAPPPPPPRFVRQQQQQQHHQQQQQQQQVDLDTRINQLMRGVITPASQSPPQPLSISPSSKSQSVAPCDHTQRKRRPVVTNAAEGQEKAAAMEKTADDHIYNLLGV